MATMFMIIAAVLIVVGTQLVKTARQQANQQTNSVAVAQNAAQAGLQDAIGWFKRQTNQPVAAETNPNNYGAAPNPTPTYPVTITTNNGPLTVTYSDQAFYPVYNTANPVSTDTIDPTIQGIVNEFSPDGAGSVSQATTDGSQPRWERYEVLQQPAGAPVSNAVHDVTGERMFQKMDGLGYVWSIQSTGYYYIRKDFTKSATAPYYWIKDYKTYPNKLLASCKMATEIRKISTTMPWGVNAALYMPDPGLLKTSTSTYVSNASQNGVYSYAGTTNNKPVTAGPKEVVGSGVTESGTVNLSPADVFGMLITEFPNLDSVVKPTTSTNFASIPSQSIIYYNGNLTIDPAGANPNFYVIGPGGSQTGLLVVNGNFTMNSTASQQNGFYGLVYVTGSVNLTGSIIEGALIVGNAGTGVTLTSSNGNPAAIYYNATMLQRMQTVVSGYLEDVTARKIFLAVGN